MEIGRLLTAMVTPFDAEGGVDYEQAQRLAVALLDSGSDGLVIAGTTGEWPTLTKAEKLRLFSEIKQAVGRRGAVIVGSSTNDTAESIELSLEAEKTGVDGLLLTVPYYNRPPQEGLYRHFEAIASGTDLPCILYNIPSRSGVNMTSETTVRLSKLPNVIGVKEASGNLEQTAKILEEAPGDFLLWSGDDQLTLPILSLGGYGVVSVVSHLAGAQMRDMIRAYLEGRPEDASRIHRRLIPLMSVLMTASTNPIPVKYALNQVGFHVGRPRLPLIEADEVVGEKISLELRRHQIDIAVVV